MNESELIVAVATGNQFICGDNDEIAELNSLFVRRRLKKHHILQAAFRAERDMTPKNLNSEGWLIRYNNYQFFRLFRMQKVSVDIQIGLIMPLDTRGVLNKKYTGGHHPLNVQLQMLVYLWYMGTQDSLVSIGTQFKVSAPTVMNVVNRLLFFVVRLKMKLVKWPRTLAELQDVADGFRNYPGAVGACDGTHVQVTVELNQQDSYIDGFRQHSINMLLICTSERLLTYFFVGFPGSTHDSRVFQNSTLVREIERAGPNQYFHDDHRFHLIGDSAFPLKTWLMTPYRDNGNLSRAEKLHNKKLSSDRVVIEHTNGQIKLRWRRLKHIHTYNISKSVEIATAACVLHNFCLLNKDLWPEEEIPLDEENNENDLGRPTIESRGKRDSIKDRLLQHVLMHV